MGKNNVANIIRNELRLASYAAMAAGHSIIRDFGKRSDLKRKDTHELVSKADMRAQQIISHRLKRAFPTYSILSEEQPSHVLTNASTWVIDPLDGTHNFVFGIPLFAVSIALKKNKHTTLGVVYIPHEDKLFTAVENGGAYLNGKKIRPSATRKISDAIVSYDNTLFKKKTFSRYRPLVNNAFTTRILGSAACDLCFVAEGVLDGRICNTTKIWDVAAAALIVTEAGGKVTDMKGQVTDDQSGELIASNRHLHGDLLRLYK